MKITMKEAVAMWIAGNNDGLGYTPYADQPDPDGSNPIDAAVEHFIADGAELILSRSSTSDVAVVRCADGEIVAIGDSNGPWAIQLVNPRRVIREES